MMCHNHARKKIFFLIAGTREITQIQKISQRLSNKNIPENLFVASHLITNLCYVKGSLFINYAYAKLLAGNTKSLSNIDKKYLSWLPNYYFLCQRKQNKGRLIEIWMIFLKMTKECFPLDIAGSALPVPKGSRQHRLGVESSSLLISLFPCIMKNYLFIGNILFSYPSFITKRQNGDKHIGIFSITFSSNEFAQTDLLHREI